MVGQKHSGQEERLLQRHGKARAPGSLSEEIRPLNSKSTGGRSGKRLDGMEISQSIRKMAGKGSPRGERMLQCPDGGALGHTFLLRKVEERRDPKETKKGTLT